jgi:hypothetical protein
MILNNIEMFLKAARYLHGKPGYGSPVVLRGSGARHLPLPDLSRIEVS